MSHTTFFLQKLHSKSMTILASFGLYRVHFHCMSNASCLNWLVWKDHQTMIGADLSFHSHLMLLSVHMCLVASVPV